MAVYAAKNDFAMYLPHLHLPGVMMEVCAATPGLCGDGDQAQGFVHAWQIIPTELYIPSPLLWPS